MAFGGYVNELVDLPPPELQCECSVCLQVVRVPYMVSCCSLRYCHTCIERVLGQGRPCPHCQAGTYTITRDSQLERILLFKRTFCIHKNRGCEWVGESRDAKRHVRDDCVWTEVPCPIQCGQQVLRCRLNQHVTEQCPRKKRPCEFVAMGCESGLLTPNSLQDHLHENMQAHLALVCHKLKEVDRNTDVAHQTELRDLKAEVQTLEKERKELKTKVQACQVDMRKVVQQAKVVHILLGVFLFIVAFLWVIDAYPPLSSVVTSPAEHFNSEWQQRWEREKEAFISTIEMLNATQQTLAQELHENFSKTMQQGHLMLNLKQMERALENQHNTVEYLRKITKGLLTQKKQEKDTVTCTCTSDVKMQCPAEKNENEPTISTITADLTSEPEGVDECSCGGDNQRLLFFTLCMSLVCIGLLTLPKCHQSKCTRQRRLCALALMAVSMTSVNYIYIWFFYSPWCLNFMSFLVRGCISPLLFYIFAYILVDKYFF